MNIRELIFIVFGLMIIIGSNMSIDYLQHTIEPLNSAHDNLDEIVSSSDSVLIHTHLFELKFHLNEIMKNLPEDKNPVWIFPTESTNFLRLQSDVDAMITSIDKISTVPKDNYEYHTGMLEINSRSMTLKDSLSDARGFVYASFVNLSFTLMWMGGVIGITRMVITNEN